MTAKFVTATALLFIVGCGGVDVGGIPVDVGDLNFNGDINVGDINFGGGNGFEDELLDAIAEELDSEESNGNEPEELDSEESNEPEPHPADTDGDFFIDNDELLAYGVAFQDDDGGQGKSWLDVAVTIWQARSDGAYFDDMESDEPFNWQPVEANLANLPEPHPADTDGNFLLTSEEVLAYALAFQNDEFDEGQDESWLDIAIVIWQARSDGAYFDDMESDKPSNWNSVDESGVVTDDANNVDETTRIDETAETTEENNATGDASGKGYDILFKVTPLSPVSFDLTVVDPIEKYNSSRTPPAETGWTEGTAWDGFYRVKVYSGNNYNGVNEQVRFSISVYKDGELVLEEEHAIAESSLWDDLSVAYP